MLQNLYAYYPSGVYQPYFVNLAQTADIFQRDADYADFMSGFHDKVFNDEQGKKIVMSCFEAQALDSDTKEKVKEFAEGHLNGTYKKIYGQESVAFEAVAATNNFALNEISDARKNCKGMTQFDISQYWWKKYDEVQWQSEPLNKLYNPALDTAEA